MLIPLICFHDIFNKKGSNRSPKCESKAEHRENTIFTMADSEKFCSDPIKKRKILQTVLLLIIYATAVWGLLFLLFIKPNERHQKLFLHLSKTMPL